ncbi:MAG: hypothetical protein ABH851_03035 [Methanobacteriota archaeon]
MSKVKNKVGDLPSSYKVCKIVSLSTLADVFAASVVDDTAFGGNGETPHTLLVSSRAGELLGTKLNEELAGIKALLFDRDGGVFSLSTSVNPGFQGMGIGTLMAEETREISINEGSGMFYTLASPRNGPQLNTYLTKMGFQASAFYPGYFTGFSDYGVGVDRLLITKDFISGGAQEAMDSEFTVSVDDSNGLSDAFSRGFVANTLLRGKSNSDNHLGFVKSNPKTRNITKHEDSLSINGNSNVKFASQNDFGRIMELDQSAFSPPSSIFFIKALALIGGLYCLKRYESTTGFVGALFDKENGIYVHGPVVHGDDPQQISELVETVFTLAKKTGRNNIWTVLPEKQNGTIRLLKTHNFRQEGIVEGLFKDSDGVILSSNLDVF